MTFSPSDEESLALSYDVKYFRFANNIITKMFDFDARILIGCQAYTLASHPIRTCASKSDIAVFMLRWPTFLMASIVQVFTFRNFPC